MNISRRRLLIFSSALAARTLLFPKLILANAPKERSVNLYNIHTCESFKGVYWTEGGYIESSLTKINKLFRDRRTNELKKIDLSLIELLRKINDITSKTINLVCGYRSIKTNEFLRKTNKGVAKHSRHILGQAADINLSGVSQKELRNIAKSLKMGGVGYYSRFVHVDIRPKLAYW